MKGGNNINQKKIGLFLKELSLPDISLIVEIADFYDVDVREIIEGERKSEMNEEIKEVAKKKTILNVVKIVTIAMAVISTYFIVSIILIFGIGLIDYSLPFTTT